MIDVIPAIDIIDGRCVRLSKGDYSTSRIYGNPLDMAKSFADAGASRLHLVDLDGAKASEPCNLTVLERIAALNALKLEWGGGLKSRSALNNVFEAGADYAIVGSLAALEPSTFETWLNEFGADRIVFGADLLDGQIRIKGWMEGAECTLDDLLARFSCAGLTQVVCTDISRDGMLSGPNTELYCDLQNRYQAIDFTVSGGISSMEDIRALDACGLRRVIVGKAYYEGKITDKELKLWWQNA